MNKKKLIVYAAGILGTVAAAAFSTGVARDAVKSFCDATVNVPVQPAVTDAGAP